MHRVTYSKEGLIKFISHLDLIRLWQRAFRRAGVPVKMSQGFSPHPLMSFGPPLPLGVEGCGEMLDVALVHGQDLTRAKERLQFALPEGIGVREFRPVSEFQASLCAAIDYASYEVHLGKECAGEVRERVAAAKSAPALVSKKQTRKGERYRDIKPLIKELEVGGDSGGEARMRFTVRVGEGGNCNPHELLEAVLGWPEERVKKLRITRTALVSSGKF
ncbi:MAG: TIGR03936 family radical SAM-associated protein [Candidatus Aureabacteria bacterium]|nr:TIGR03936 family radical SAM-associated protein [Candidatus Auribacterota bacterium]